MSDKSNRVNGLLFEYERISDHVMDFGCGVSLKLVADLGFKDSSNHKRRAYEEYRYKNTSKYDNTDYLISASRRAEYYLKIEYPTNMKNGGLRKNNILIKPYSMLGFVGILEEFDKTLFGPYKQKKNGDVYLIEDKIKTIRSSPTPNSLIEFSHGMYTTYDEKLDYGVNIGLNEEYYFTIRSTTTWKQFYYYMSKCDLYLWGSMLLGPYITKLITGAVSDIGGAYSGTKRYEVTFEPEPEDTVKISKTKPLTKQDKIKSFFDD
jgi:hypothetical protein